MVLCDSVGSVSRSRQPCYGGEGVGSDPFTRLSPQPHPSVFFGRSRRSSRFELSLFGKYGVDRHAEMAEDLIDHLLEPLALLVVVPDFAIVLVVEPCSRLRAADRMTWHVLQ